ncbi:MAG TPA: DNA helicase PcrA [Actinomycetota bacterium]|nr:DNA helicase PcrA [Actinomycetota bacterium]
MPPETDLLTGLNPVQREAVAHDGGPLLVVAGAGSGKTKVLTHRIAYLIRERKISPFAILAITFTNKAAGEMKERVGGLVGSRLGAAMWVMTFHSACARILRADGVRLGFTSSFTIYDDADAERLITYISKELDVDPRRFTPRQIKNAIGNAKDKLVDEEMLAQAAGRNPYDRTIAEVYALYQARLRQANAMDFDDLIMNTVHLFRLYDDVLEEYRDKFTHVLIDEFQDTNHAQYVLAKLLAERDRNICVVGDLDQSIYKFRGADFTNVLRFEEDFPDARVVTLEQNYRSTQTILSAANAVIENNQMRKPKSLWTEMAGGELITRYHAENEHEEAAWIAREIERLREEDTRRYGDIALFYRTNAQSRVLEEIFVRMGLPYRVVCSLKFYDRKEIKDAIAYLRVLVNPADEVSLRRIINTPRRGIGDQTIAALARFADMGKMTLSEAVDRVEENDELAARARSMVSDLSGVLRGLREKVERGAEPADVLEALLDRSGYVAELEADRSIEAVGRVENLKELVGVAREFSSDNAEGGVREFLEQIALVSDADEITGEEGAVTMMTLHIAKGLEFPVVFIVGLEDGVFPHVRSMTDPAELEEERRLAYVGITRAKERLYLTHAWQRSLWGGSNFNPPSRFLKEIPEELVHAVQAGDESEKLAEMVQPKSAALSLAVGDDVFHERWGRGTVVAVSGRGNSAEASVHFESEGTKRLLLAYAPLQRI